MYYLIITIVIEFLLVFLCIGIQLILSRFGQEENKHLLYGKKYRWIIGMVVSGILTLISILLYVFEVEESILYIVVTSIYIPFWSFLYTLNKSGN